MPRYDALLTAGAARRNCRGLRALGFELAKFGTRDAGQDQTSRLAAALSALGPSYIKLGQFLATRPDLVGAERAFELKALQDRLPPFRWRRRRDVIRANLGADVEDLFTRIRPASRGRVDCPGAQGDRPPMAAMWPSRFCGPESRSALPPISRVSFSPPG